MSRKPVEKVYLALQVVKGLWRQDAWHRLTAGQRLSGSGAWTALWRGIQPSRMECTAPMVVLASGGGNG